MIKLITKSDHHHGEVTGTLVLPFALRQKGRFKATSTQGVEVGVFLPRGDLIRSGDYLISECGQTFKVEAEAEAVITATSDNWLTFAKACYHLGNRHVPLQVGELWLRFQPDHVLQQMVELHGLSCRAEQAEFTPESGAYAGGHGGGHSHSHHDHSHHHHDEPLKESIHP